MADDTKRIDALLSEWARWGLGALEQLGYPRETLDSRVARFGFTGAAQGGSMPEWPQHIVWMEQAVLRIQQIERSVLVEEYLNPWEPRNVHARHRHMSEARYGKVLERARKSVRRELLSIIPSDVTQFRVEELVGRIGCVHSAESSGLAACA
jgi:hypothetical protein